MSGDVDGARVGPDEGRASCASSRLVFTGTVGGRTADEPGHARRATKTSSTARCPSAYVLTRCETTGGTSAGLRGRSRARHKSGPPGARRPASSATKTPASSQDSVSRSPATRNRCPDGRGHGEAVGKTMTSRRVVNPRAVSVLVTSTRHVLPCSTVHVPAGGNRHLRGHPRDPYPHRCDQRPRLADGAALDLPEGTRGSPRARSTIVRVTRGEPTMVIRWTSRVSRGPDCGHCRQLVGRR